MTQHNTFVFIALILIRLWSGVVRLVINDCIFVAMVTLVKLIDASPSAVHLRTKLLKLNILVSNK